MQKKKKKAGLFSLLALGSFGIRKKKKTKNDEHEGRRGGGKPSGNTAETGEETFANSAVCKRTAGPPPGRMTLSLLTSNHLPLLLLNAQTT